ncbi:MAG: TIGR01459 family HAD-type hydrolase [Alphaproteobacteria bacterium]|nr:TIGR01459 family HAD-type hydrolase [Alphaproteobacteria bacterium]
MQFYPSLASIASKYDGFILDLWGVIHDGTALYPGVKPCLESLRKQGKKIVFLSNAPRRAGKVEEKLNELGISAELYDHVLSSGEVAYNFLALPENLALQQKYYYLGPEKDADLLHGLAYVRCEDMADADFILAVDVEYHGQEVAELEPYLTEARRHNLPMVCVNPDIEVVKQDGTHIWCAGAVAQHYEGMGGEVSYFGKPYPAVYETALTLLDSIKRDAILAVGDNIDTDIKGGNLNAIDTALVTGGILARDMPNPNPYELRELCERKGALPSFVIPGFTWKNQPLT